jgi:hypothetical protein
MASFAYFCAGVLMTSGESLIGLLYDRRYESAGWMLEVLAIGMLTVPFRAAAMCLVALGMPHLLLQIIVIRTLTLCIGIPGGFYLFGLGGALTGIVLSYYAGLWITIFNMRKLNLFDIRKELFLVPVIAVGVALGKGISLGIGHFCCK